MRPAFVRVCQGALAFLYSIQELSSNTSAVGYSGIILKEMASWVPIITILYNIISIIAYESWFICAMCADTSFTCVWVASMPSEITLPVELAIHKLPSDTDPFKTHFSRLTFLLVVSSVAILHWSPTCGKRRKSPDNSRGWPVIRSCRQLPR